MKKQGVVKKFFKGLLTSKQQTNSFLAIQVQRYQQKPQQDWTEAEAQIINHLINMDSIMRITKQLDYYHEYITLEKINEVLCQEVIDLSQSKKALLGGLVIDDTDNDRKYTTKNLPYQYYSLRSLLWKINFQYLNTQIKRKWVTFLEKNLLSYWKMVEEFIVAPVEKKICVKPATRKKFSECPAEASKKDHPLNFSHESKWQNYFKDLEMWQQIEKDTRRTRKSCTFFQQPYSLDLSQIETILDPNQITFFFENTSQLTYADCLTRIIFLYLKKHPQEFYCQGMNEFAAMVFYCFTNKNSEYFRRISESDAFFIFQRIMGMLPKKHFQKGPDYVKKLNTILLKVDLRLHEEIQKQGGIQTLQLLTMRWFMTGFLNEFQIDECLQLWDVIIGWPDSQMPLCDRFMYMAISMIHLHRDRIMEGENVASMLSKIEISVIELGEKTLNLFKIFPKLVGQ